MTHRRDDDIEREIRAHLELEAEEREADGLSRTDAEYAARRAFGNVTVVHEDVRAVWTSTWLDETRQDLRYALRTLRSNPGFAAVAIVTLALGIGATTATFSVVRGVLLQPLPFKDADRIVRIVENVPAAESFSGRPTRLPSMNLAEFDWWRTEATTLSHMAVAMPETRTVVTANGATRLQGARVSPALFEMRGVPPLVGRWLRADEERPATAAVVVLAESTWRRYFGGDANLVGRGIALGGQAHTVVGVMPDSFGPEAFWMPFVVGASRGAVMFVPVTARLRDSVTLEAATAEINTLGARLRRGALPPGHPARFEVIGEQDQMVAGVRPALRMLVLSVAVVLLIVCANVGNLLLTRGLRRHQEIGLRRALGATRFRVVRQLLTESIVLSVAGGVAGAAFAYVAVSFVRAAGVIEVPARFRFALGRLGETILPRVNEITVDPGALLFASTLSLVTGVVFGLVPAVQLSSVDQGTVTAAASTQRGASSVSTYVGGLLASVQLALATALLVTAGLLVYSFVKLSSLPLGFDAGTQIFQLVSPGDFPPSRKLALAAAVEEQLQAQAGVDAVGFTNTAQPLEVDRSQRTIVPPSWPVDGADPGDDNRSEGRSVTAGYLRALGVRLVEGRWFDDRIPAGPAQPMLVNRAWVRRFSPNRSPIGTTAVGRCSALSRACVDTSYEIVGVVDDVRLRLEGGSGEPIGGFPRTDMPKVVFGGLRHALPPPEVMDRPGRVDMGGAGSAGGPDGFAFAVRVRSAPLTAAHLRRVVREVDPLLSVEDLSTMGEVVSAITARPRVYAAVLSAFGGFAAFIAAMGVYGVLAYSMSQRTREFGVRLALGAVPSQVLRLALRQGVLVVAVGIPAGVMGATAVTRYLSGMLFGLTPLDVVTYATVAIGFAVVAMFASYLPARRATRVNPVVALRCE
jgi:putative ABC transport system permease protein